MKEKMIRNLIITVLCIFVLTTIVLMITSHKNNKIINNNEVVIENEEEENNILKVIIDPDEKEETIDEEANNVQDNITKKQEDNEQVKPNSKAPYYIKVNNKANTVTVYKKDDNGDYTIPIKAMICSVGDYTPPCAKYSKTSYVTNGDKYKWASLEGHVYGQYATRIVGGILFHSVPYTDGWKNSAKGSIEYWEYDKLGTKASLGCVRLKVEDAKWIYDNIGKGTTVEFYSDDNPGPLGKPTAKKISDYPDYLRGWDPTDPDSKNPWKTYVEPVNAEPTKTAEPTKASEEKQPQNNENNNTIKNETVTKDNNTMNTINNNNNNTNNTIGNTTTNNTISNNTVTGNTTTNNTTINNNNTSQENNVSDNIVSNNTVTNNTN